MFQLNVQIITVRLLTAFVIGGLVGYTREKDDQAAGFRTHIVVALGAAFISLIQVALSNQALEWGMAHPDFAEMITVDLSRFSAQAVTGISFLGAGTIIVTQNKSVKGLTTAASIWATAGLGLAAGYGYYWIAIIGTILLLITLVLLKFVIHKQTYILEIHFEQRRSKMKDLFEVLDNYDLAVKDIDFKNDENFAYIFELSGDSTSVDTVELTQTILSDVNYVSFVNIS